MDAALARLALQRLGRRPAPHTYPAGSPPIRVSLKAACRRTMHQPRDTGGAPRGLVVTLPGAPPDLFADRGTGVGMAETVDGLTHLSVRTEAMEGVITRCLVFTVARAPPAAVAEATNFRWNRDLSLIGEGTWDLVQDPGAFVGLHESAPGDAALHVVAVPGCRVQVECECMFTG